MALGHNDTDLRVLPAPAAVPECIAWAVLPRERVLRDYALDLGRNVVHGSDAPSSAARELAIFFTDSELTA